MICDTSPDAQAVLTDLYRKMSPAQKIHRVLELSRLTRELALSRIHEAHPEFSKNQAQSQLIEELYGVHPLA